MKLLPVLLLLSAPALADAPVVEDATATQTGATWTVSVTLSHPDTGWDHYADGWRIETADGQVLGTRDLLHPHVNEQPFTRSLPGVTIPQGITQVLIRPRCNVDEWAKATFALERPD